MDPNTQIYNDEDTVEDSSESSWSENSDPISVGYGQENSECPALSIILEPTDKELRRIREMVHFLIKCLYRMPIRQSAALDRVKSSFSSAASFFQHFDTMYVHDR